MADRRHVDPELVGPPGMRLKLDPGGAIAGALDHPIARSGRLPAFLVDMHLLAAGAGLLGERQVDQPVRHRRYPGHKRPVDLDRKSTRLNSSHANISYAVFCLKK